MAAVPLLNASEIIKAFESFGWLISRQNGSHIILVQPNHLASLSVPNHKPVARGTLRSLIRSAGLTVDQFISAL